jgi:hypothetical protein
VEVKNERAARGSFARSRLELAPRPLAHSYVAYDNDDRPHSALDVRTRRPSERSRAPSPARSSGYRESAGSTIGTRERPDFAGE